MQTYSPTPITLREQNKRVAKIMRNNWFKTGVLSMIAVFGLSFVVQTNSLSTKGYTISGLEKKVTELENQNRQLEVQIAQFQSMHSIKERIKGSNLVSAGTPEYGHRPKIRYKKISVTRRFFIFVWIW